MDENLNNVYMKNLLTSLFAFFLLSNAYGQTVSLTIQNTSDKNVVDYMAEVPLSVLKKLPVGNYVAIVDNQTVPVEITADLKGVSKALFPIASIGAKEIKNVTITVGDANKYPKRTYSELSHRIGGSPKNFTYDRKDTVFTWVKPNYMKVPGSFRDHAFYIKYEGPGWESDKVAFRFYLDQRNAVDVFAKSTPGIVLPQIGIDGYENYHNPKVSHWGVDNMTVGDALGIGSIAYWNGEKAGRVGERDSVECFIQADGKIRSQVMTTYFGWNVDGVKYNLKSLISIDAGSRASHMELQANKNIPNLATGIIKKDGAELLISNEKNVEWSYIATWGKQSQKDKYQDSSMMGLVVFVRTKQIKEITSDNLNQVVVLKPENGYVDYYFMPTWEHDWEPVVTKADFMKCIDEVLTRLNNPVTIKTK